MHQQAAFFFVSLYPSYEEGSEPQRKASSLVHFFFYPHNLKYTFDISSNVPGICMHLLDLFIKLCYSDWVILRVKDSFLVNRLFCSWRFRAAKNVIIIKCTISEGKIMNKGWDREKLRTPGLGHNLLVYLWSGLYTHHVWFKLTPLHTPTGTTGISLGKNNTRVIFTRASKNFT